MRERAPPREVTWLAEPPTVDPEVQQVAGRRWTGLTTGNDRVQQQVIANHLVQPRLVSAAVEGGEVLGLQAAFESVEGIGALATELLLAVRAATDRRGALPQRLRASSPPTSHRPPVRRHERVSRSLSSRCAFRVETWSPRLTRRMDDLQRQGEVRHRLAPGCDYGAHFFPDALAHALTVARGADDGKPRSSVQ